MYNDHPVDTALNTISGCARLLNMLKRELMKNRYSRLTQFQLGYLKKKISPTNKFNSSSI